MYWLAFALIFVVNTAHAGQDQDIDERLSVAQVFTETPQTFLHAFHLGTEKESATKWLAVAATTAPLLIYDEDIYVATARLGRQWGLSNRDELRPYGKVYGDFVLTWGPSDVSSSLYFLGDGWIHLGLATGLMATGYFGDHTRSFNTAVELFNGFLSSTIFEQLLKYSFGREDPGVRTAPGGAWHPFPGWAAYQSERTLHDAFPSGHVMTTTVTFTVLRANYPEWESWLWPTQVVYTSLLGFGMVNNGIHWAGDYPLGLMLGYLFGKSAVKMAHKADSAATASIENLFEASVVPRVDDLTGEPIASLTWNF